MSEREPGQGAEVGPQPLGAARAGSSRVPAWAAWLGGVVGLVVLVVAAAALAVAQPWAADDRRAQVVLPSVTASGPVAERSASPTASGPATPSRPVRSTVFDVTSLASLFVTPADLATALPAGTPTLTPGLTTGQLAWGLAAGVTIEPATCALAQTVVAVPPASFDARTWSDGGVEFAQQVTLLPDVATAEAAFSSLVTAVDACPAYSVLTPGATATSITAAPATEAQGVFPSLVQPQQTAQDAGVVPQLHGHVLVGNAIVTWTASAHPVGGGTADVATLGSASDLDTMVQQVALRAATSIG